MKRTRYGHFPIPRPLGLIQANYMRTVRARSALIIMSALLLAVAAADSEVDCGAMRTKELRKWLAARGLKCEGCAEKADYVTLWCEQNKDAPLLPPEEPLACVARERLLVIDKWPATSAKAASMVLILLYI